MIYASVILTSVSLVSIFNARPRVWAVDEVPVAFWAWRTQSPDKSDIQAAVEKAGAQVLFLRAGQIDYQDGKLRRIRPLAGSFPKGIKLHLVYNTTRAVLEQLESLDPQSTPYVIFVTAYDQYAVRAFEVHAFDYLLKPFDHERFDAAWQRVKDQIKLDQTGERDRHILALLEELKSGPRHLERLVIKNGGRVFFLNVQDVHCIESEGNYVRVYDNQKGYLLRETISSLEEQLDPRQFRRIHRSAIVKIDRIKEMQPWFHGEYRIIMENGKELTLSRNYRANFQGAVGNAI